jgi:hypothetical protein
MYDLGRQAHAAGFGLEACNLSKSNPLRSWWVAGHIDRDIETKAMEQQQELAA